MATEVATRIAPPVVSSQRWSAIDVDTETRLDRELSRSVPWRKALLRWLIEYNKY